MDNYNFVTVLLLADGLPCRYNTSNAHEKRHILEIRFEFDNWNKLLSRCAAFYRMCKRTKVLFSFEILTTDDRKVHTTKLICEYSTITSWQCCKKYDTSAMAVTWRTIQQQTFKLNVNLYRSQGIKIVGALIFLVWFGSKYVLRVIHITLFWSCKFNLVLYFY